MPKRNKVRVFEEFLTIGILLYSTALTFLLAFVLQNFLYAMALFAATICTGFAASERVRKIW